MRALNYLAHKAEKSLQVEMNHEMLADNSLQHLLDELQRIKVCVIKGRQILFADESARFFANGGWLEVHAFKALQQVKRDVSTVQDIAASVLVQRLPQAGSPTKNELDVLMLADNRLYVVECKAKYFDSYHEDPKVQDAIYKLSTVQKSLGGIQAQGVLLSFQSVSEFDKKRAANNRVQVIDGHQLRDLAGHFKSLLTG
jgi:hypothetical protein